MKKKAILLALAGLLVLAFCQVAYPALKAVGPVIPDTDPGPNWSVDYNGFPLWYRDSDGVTVELRAPPDPLQVFDPVDDAFPFSTQIGFGTEAMWWDCNAVIDLGNGNNAILVMALEAAFAQGDAIDGDQIAFARIRIRIDAPTTGLYTVYYPYGSRTFNVTTQNQRNINTTIDIGVNPGNFTGALKGEIGPFLKQVNPAPPVGYLGDAATDATVTGSPITHPTLGPQNFFRVEGPDIGGPGVNFVHTNLFVTSGKLFTGTAFTAGRTTYSRDANGVTFVEVWATCPTPLVTGQIPQVRAQLPGGTPILMQRIGTDFFKRLSFPSATFPAQVALTGTTNGVNPTTFNSNLVDVVTITQATYEIGTKTLTIAAISSDVGTPAPELRGFGWRGGGAGTVLDPSGVTVFTPVTIAPDVVTVTSSRGGSDSFKTTILP